MTAEKKQALPPLTSLLLPLGTHLHQNELSNTTALSFVFIVELQLMAHGKSLLIYSVFSNSNHNHQQMQMHEDNTSSYS